MKRSIFSIALIFTVLLFDQLVKIWVKLNMRIGDAFNFFGEGQNWFQIYFTENPGMAFGIELGGDYGKLALSLFRIVAVFFISYYLYLLIQQKKSLGLIASISLIWAGAVGNILDSIFYGLMFSESSIHSVAQWTSLGEGYASFLHGRVVDMLYFPLIEGNYPSWFPMVGGQRFQFFQPIFNIADTSISVGVGMVILFYRSFFKEDLEKPISGKLKEPELSEKENNTSNDLEEQISEADNQKENENLN